MKEHRDHLHATGDSEPAGELLHRAIASSHNGITIGHVDGGQIPLIYANPAFYRMTGYTPEEIIGQDCRLLQGDMTGQEGLAIIRAALAQGTEATALLCNVRKDGSEFWNELTVSPVLNDRGVLTHYIGIHNDVTRRENDAQAIAALKQALTLRSEELEMANGSLRSFPSSISHDLRAPLSSIQGFCSALRKSIDGTADSRALHYMARIEANADRMEKLIEAMLKMGQSSAGELSVRSCDLSMMAQEVVTAYRTTSPTSTAHVRIEPGLSAVGDPALLHSVLENLIGNALKYSSKTPNASVHFGREARVSGETRFFVRDNGAGFDMAKASKLFGPFQRLHSNDEFPGTGVGLATVHSVITRHGGAVSAEAAPGKGAVFYFSLDSAPG